MPGRAPSSPPIGGRVPGGPLPWGPGRRRHGEEALVGTSGLVRLLRKQSQRLVVHHFVTGATDYLYVLNRTFIPLSLSPLECWFKVSV